jgi:hypothetical protein
MARAISFFLFFGQYLHINILLLYKSKYVTDVENPIFGFSFWVGKGYVDMYIGRSVWLLF